MSTSGTALHLIELWRAAATAPKAAPASHRHKGPMSAAGRYAQAVAAQRLAVAKSVEARRSDRAARVADLLAQRVRDLADQEARRRKRAAAKARTTEAQR